MANGETPNPVLGVQVPPPLIHCRGKKARCGMIKKINTFLTEVRGELAKVSWSTREELMGSTAVVLVFTALMTIFIGMTDFVLSFVLKVLFR